MQALLTPNSITVSIRFGDGEGPALAVRTLDGKLAMSTLFSIRRSSPCSMETSRSNAGRAQGVRRSARRHPLEWADSPRKPQPDRRGGQRRRARDGSPSG